MVEKSGNWKKIADELGYKVYDSVQWKNRINAMVRICIYSDGCIYDTSPEPNTSLCMDIYCFGLNSQITVSILDFNQFLVYDKNKIYLENCFNIADYLCKVLFCNKI